LRQLKQYTREHTFEQRLSLEKFDMNSPHQISFRVSCSIGNESVIALTLIDKKNNSVHFHLYGKMFGGKRQPIQVKNSGMELIVGKEEELITKILTDHFSDKEFQINTIEKQNP
jgi:hypothetical protein